MAENTIIFKNVPLPKSVDYSYLRDEGVKFIQQLGRDRWTDYNIHDPGITLLELLCYALTDLGHRTNHSIQDLLTGEGVDGRFSKGKFHTAKDILTSGPITFEDLRKIIVDIEGIRNAWISKNNQIKYQLNEGLEALVDNPELENLPSVALNGLYDVCIEYEEYVELLLMGVPDITQVEGRYIEPAGRGMQFQIDRDIIIESVNIYASEPGELNLLLLDYKGKEVAKFSRNIVDEQLLQKLPIFLDIRLDHDPINPEANVYQLLAESEQVQLFAHRNQKYPLTKEDFARIIGSSEEDNYYYFFYDWDIEPTEDYSPTRQICRVRAGLLNNAVNSCGKYEKLGSGFLAFDLLTDVRLDAVSIYPFITKEEVPSAEIQIKLLGSDGKLVCGDDGKELSRTFTVTQGAGKMRVPLKWELKKGENYWMIAQLAPEEKNEVKIYANDDIYFPIEKEGVIRFNSEKGAKETADGRIKAKYFGFYNWEIYYETELEEDLSGAILYSSQLRRKVREVIMQHRNLCEDVMTVKEAKTEEIGVAAEVHLKLDANAEEIKAEILFRLENYVKPPVRFYTLEEMLEQNTPVEDIFEGPFLEHGFLNAEEFKNTFPKKEIRASDIIQLVMNIEGVELVEKVLLQRIEDGRVVEENPWFIRTSGDACSVPNFQPERSCLAFFKQGLLVDIRDENMMQRLEAKLQTNNPPRLKGGKKDFEVPVGEPWEVGVYYSIQNNLPANYMVGQFRVPDSAPAIRKAQSLQLKAYLLFFEQLLANYLAQLGNISQVFSWETAGSEPPKTYFTQEIKDIPELDKIYKNYEDLSQTLESLIKEADNGLERRNRFLDHLIARFAESFTDYSLLMFGLMDKTDKVQARLIKDKQAFLQDYPQISGKRAQAFNYTLPIEEQMLSGFQQRVYRLLGIQSNPDFRRRLLTGNAFEIKKLDAGSKEEWLFQIVDNEENGTVIFTSETYESVAIAEQVMQHAFEVGTNIVNYKEEGQYCVLSHCPIPDDPGKKEVIGKTSPQYLDKVIALFKQAFDAEGFHLLEHILLRRRSKTTPFLPIDLPGPEECDRIPVFDPYSFRVTVILPTWPSRFQDINFRAYTEHILRTEAPAHIQLNILWTNYVQMGRWERAYWKWLEALQKLPSEWSGQIPIADQLPEEYTGFSEAIDELYNVLFGITTVYPQARLYEEGLPGIDPSEYTLGSVSLGTTKIEEDSINENN